jgi:hypothetical protein
MGLWSSEIDVLLLELDERESLKGESSDQPRLNQHAEIAFGVELEVSRVSRVFTEVSLGFPITPSITMATDKLPR